MNKQVVSFLSLFSLVLVLSIYYVVVPATGKTTLVNDEISSSNSELTINDAPSLFFTTLSENRKARHEEVKNKQIDILASSSYSNEEKIEAKAKLTFEELIETTETGLENSMNELEFNETFVEKLDNYYYVTIYDGTLTNENDYKNVLSVIETFNDYFSMHELDELETYKPVVNFVTF